MKIFNWMHRKLHPNISYSQVSQKKGAFGGESEKKEEMARQREGERDTEALLLHDVLDGILTIGTLGNGHPCHPLFSQSYSPQEESLQKEQEKEEEEDEDEDEDEEEQEVLAVAAFVVEEYKPVAVVESSKIKLALGEEDKKMLQMVVEEEEEAEKLLEEPLLKDTEKREKGRTTLADLFAADASMGEVTSKKPQATNPATRSQAPCRKTSTQHKKKGKNSPQSNPASTKLHRLITRMLKKKIHPELNERSTDEVSLMAGRVEDFSSHSELRSRKISASRPSHFPNLRSPLRLLASAPQHTTESPNLPLLGPRHAADIRNIGLRCYSGVRRHAADHKDADFHGRSGCPPRLIRRFTTTKRQSSIRRPRVLWIDFGLNSCKRFPFLKSCDQNSTGQNS